MRRGLTKFRFDGRSYYLKEDADRRIAALETHAADCKRLVTACEDDIDALRLLNREYKADRDKAETELDRIDPSRLVDRGEA